MYNLLILGGGRTIRRPLPEIESSVLEYLESPSTLQSCKPQSAITAIPCNLTSCELHSTYSADCALPHCIISKG